jgi:hypothetical protein
MRKLILILLWQIQHKYIYAGECYFCHQKLTEADFPIDLHDNIAIHHINCVHEDDRFENLALSHRKCHQDYHRKHDKKVVINSV